METNEVVLETETSAVVIRPSSLRRRFEKGVTTVEYAVMVACVAVAVYAFGGTLATKIQAGFVKIGAMID